MRIRIKIADFNVTWLTGTLKQNRYLQPIVLILQH
jgi:hypothetical protein